MRHIKWFLTCALTVFVYLSFATAQENNKGIRFETGLNWDQIKAKARAENKFIFVDCYATWCGPCKMMDMQIYPNDTVGAYMNPRFISMKMQLDTSKRDNEDVKARYPDARQIMSDYQVNAFPTFLFFSPEGKLVHKGLGYQTKNAFIELAKAATDPAKQYYAYLTDYHTGKKDYSNMLQMMAIAKSFRDIKTYEELANDYGTKYIPTLSNNDAFTKDNLLFISSELKYMANNDRYFYFIKDHPFEADSIVHLKTFAKSVIDIVLKKVDIEDKVWRVENEKIVPITNSPDWKKIRDDIKAKYGCRSKYADSLVYPYSVAFYYFKHDWANYIKYIDAAIKKYKPNPKSNQLNYAINSRTDGSRFQGNDLHGLNEDAWWVFVGCDDKKLLQHVISWSDLVIKLDSPTPGEKFDELEFAEYYDTKANLLYKLGQTREAISIEQKALSLQPDAKDISGNLEKMKRNLPTWKTGPIN